MLQMSSYGIAKKSINNLYRDELGDLIGFTIEFLAAFLNFK